MMANDSVDSAVLFYILNGYGVTVLYLIVNITTAILGLVIIYLNYLVMSTMFIRRDTLELADVYVASLAGADLLTGIILLYNTAYNCSNYQNSDECRFRYGLFVIVAICSGFHLLALALDRCVKVMKPLQYYTLFTKKMAAMACLFIWSISTIIGLLPTIGWKNDYEENNGDSVQCTFFGTMSDGYILLVSLLIWMTVALLLVIYLSIFKVAHRHAKVIMLQERAMNQNNNRTSKTVDRQSWKFTKTISIIVGLYVSMWMPTGILFIIHLEGKLEHLTTVQKGTILLYASISASLNSLLDPIIYAIKIQCVKRRFIQKFPCCKRKSQLNSNTVGVLTSVGIS